MGEKYTELCIQAKAEGMDGCEQKPIFKKSI